MSQAAQSELTFPEIDGGSYEICGSRATWARRCGNDSVIDLQFRGTKYTVTRENRGVAGNARFLVNGYTQPDGKRLQARSIRELVRILERFGPAIIRRLDRLEAKIEAGFERLEKRIAGKKKPCPRKLPLCKLPKLEGNGIKEYFNPFVVDWRGTKEFFQIPEWVARSPMTPLQALVYSRLLFPLAGDGGFCKCFDQELGIVFGLNCGSLAKRLNRRRDSIEETVKALHAECRCIELIGNQGQTKTLRYLRTPWMSEAWIAACATSGKKPEGENPTSGKKPEVENPTSGKKPEAENPTSGKTPEVASYKTNPESNQSPKNESKEIRAPSRGMDSEKRARGNFAVSRDAYADPLWHRLWDICGPTEMRANGMRWAMRFGLERETVETILRDYQDRPTPAENPGAWLGSAWMKSPAEKREEARKAKG